jgi:hypothetical protein
MLHLRREVSRPASFSDLRNITQLSCPSYPPSAPLEMATTDRRWSTWESCVDGRDLGPPERESGRHEQSVGGECSCDGTGD